MLVPARHSAGDGLAEGRLRAGLLEVLVRVEHGDRVPPVDVQVHSFCDHSGMLSVALPPVLVATGAMVTGALAALLLLVPQSWAVPAARLTFLIE